MRFRRETHNGSGWAVIGAPLDSSGDVRGEERAPAALRAAGLIDSLGGTDLGDIAMRIDDPTRHRDSGVIGFHWLRAASLELRDRLSTVLDRGERPLVLGGDCSLLLGVFAELGRRFDTPGLWMVDGHPDFWDGTSSRTGEAADMALAILTGQGPPGLVDLARRIPMVEPENVVLLGHRSRRFAEAPKELRRIPRAIHRVDAQKIIGSQPRRVGSHAAERLASRTDGAWLHIDLDVLDERTLPAVTYPQGGGLSWAGFSELLPPLSRSPALIGVSVADLNPDLDPDRSYTRFVAALLTEALAGRRATPFASV